MPQVMMDRSSSEDIMADSHSHSAPFLVGPTTSSASASASSSADDGFPSVRRRSLREAARFLRHASSRRMMMRQPSVAVREAAAAQLEERQSDWAYSKPVVILDVVWNVIFVVVAITVLVMSVGESPGVPLRLWLVGYAIQCGLHVFCVIVEFRRRQRLRRRMSLSPSPPSFESVMRFGSSGDDSSSGSRRNSGQQYDTFPLFHEEGAGAGAGSTAKHLESANTMFSFVWWIIGFYWVSSNTQALANESPQLYWLCIVFLALDVFFVIFCVALACIIGIAVCCCLPCIIAILYAVADQEGATKQDIEQLLKFKFRRIDKDKVSGSTQGPVGGVMTECGTDLPTDRVLSEEDAECCICLSAYEDGVELRELPCGHHFHCACVDKWLYINATCPLCKYNVLKGSNNAQEEV